MATVAPGTSDAFIAASTCASKFFGGAATASSGSAARRAAIQCRMFISGLGSGARGRCDEPSGEAGLDESIEGGSAADRVRDRQADRFRCAVDGLVRIASGQRGGV